MKQFFTLLCLCISFPLMAQHINPIQEAMNLYDYETALALIDKEASTTHLLHQKAQALRGLNRYTEALVTYREVIAATPQNQRIMIEMAECNRLAGRLDEALGIYEQVLNQNPENKYVQLQYISLLCMMEQYSKAGTLCSQMMKTDSTTEVLRLLSQSYEGIGFTNDAIECYQAILKKEPSDYTSVAKLARLQIKKNEFKEAIAITEKYRENDTTNIFVNRQNAQAYCLDKDYSTALNRYEYLTSRGDSTQQTCYYLGMCYYIKQKFYEAHDFLEMAYNYEPNNINILYYYGMACAKTSWKKQGVKLINDAIDIATPSDTLLINLYTGLIESTGMAGMPTEKIEAYKELYKLKKQSHTILYNIASIYFYELRNQSSAERYLEMFLKTKPKESSLQATMEDGTLVLDDSTYYNAATKWLEALKKEKFFKEGMTNQEYFEKINELGEKLRPRRQTPQSATKTQ